MTYVPKPFIPGFDLIEKIGEGGMGTVWKATQLSLGRVVAVKILAEDFAADENYIARFHREIRAAARLNHPNIVRVFEANRVGNLHYLVMEYVDGRPLTRRLAELRRIPEKESLQIILDIARALKFAWDSEQLIHRDVKPDNILLTRNGTAKIADFGLAKRAYVEEEAELSAAGLTVGTPHYISPEQARGEHNVDARADLYSLGATLYHILTGKPPFDDTSNAAILDKHIKVPPVNPRQLNSHLSLTTAAIVEKLLQKKPVDRYQSAQELITDVEMFLAGETPDILPPPKATTKRPLKFAIASAVIVSVAIAVWFFVPRKRPPPDASSPPASAPSDGAASLFNGARDFVEANPGQFTAALARLQELRPHLANTEYIAPLRKLIEDTENRREIAAAEAFIQLTRQAQPFIEKEQFIKAAAVYDTLPAELREPRVLAKIQQAKASLQTTAQQRLTQLRDEFHSLLKSGNRVQAAAVLDRMAHIESPEVASLLKSLRADLK